MNGGVNAVVDGVDSHGEWSRAGCPVRTPHVVVGGFSDGARLSQAEIVVLHVVEKNVQRPGDNPVDSRVEKGRGGIRISFGQDSQGVGGFQTIETGPPERSKLFERYSNPPAPFFHAGIDGVVTGPLDVLLDDMQNDNFSLGQPRTVRKATYY